MVFVLQMHLGAACSEGDAIRGKERVRERSGEKD